MSGGSGGSLSGDKYLLGFGFCSVREQRTGTHWYRNDYLLPIWPYGQQKPSLGMPMWYVNKMYILLFMSSHWFRKVCNIYLELKILSHKDFFYYLYMHLITLSAPLATEVSNQYYHFHIHLYTLEMLSWIKEQRIHCKDKMLLKHCWECHCVEHLLVFLILKIEYYLFCSIIVLKDCKNNQNIAIHFC